MDEGEIIKIIDKHVRLAGGARGVESVVIANVGPAAAELALDYFPRQLAAKDAQIADMREALGIVDRFIKSLEQARPDLLSTWPVREVVDKALADAPEVL